MTPVVRCQKPFGLEKVAVGRVVRVKGDGEKSHLAGGAESLATGSDDLVDIQENSFTWSSGGDIRDEFEVAGFFANEEALSVAIRTAQAEW